MANLKVKLGGAALAATVSLVMWFENGPKGPRLEPYRDPVGIWTDCTGHTGPDVLPGKRNTPAQCQAKLDADLAVAEGVVNRCYPGLTGPAKGAMVSLSFNMGPGGKGVKDGVCTLKSGNLPTMRRKWAARDLVGMCNEIPKWNAQKLPGLTKRRAEERLLCLKGLEWPAS